MNKTDKIHEAEVQLQNREHYNYQPLEAPMVKTTQQKVYNTTDELHRGKHVDDMTRKWLSQSSSPPRIPIFYTLTKIHKPKPVGRPVISGCDGPTERISSFVDTLLQPIANSMQGIRVVQQHNDPPIPTHYVRDMLGVILTENSFEFNGNNYLQTHGVAMGTKTAVNFANIYMAEIETNLIQQSNTKPREWKRYIDDVFSLWDCNRKDVELFIKEANNFHPTIKLIRSRPKYQRTT